MLLLAMIPAAACATPTATVALAHVRWKATFASPPTIEHRLFSSGIEMTTYTSGHQSVSVMKLPPDLAARPDR